jgi:hypothetical protein
MTVDEPRLLVEIDRMASGSSSEIPGSRVAVDGQ